MRQEPQGSPKGCASPWLGPISDLRHLGGGEEGERQMVPPQPLRPFHLGGRKKQKLAKERAGLSKLPDLKDAEAVQKFFLEEIQLGEELLAQGEYEKGVDHLTNAIAVCGQPQQLLQVLQQTLPPPVFQMLLTKLPTISQRIVSAQSLAEDDVE
uniref:Mitochondrial import receptor subunit TOM20 homolog n=1 Tax=Pipistrellus kuhlii TaxID=59472 RepID=A0A7J7TQH6_PIPKU|nr:translocase of outer mitochondrial membrane 20 [Pipistrellus kuhlii]